MQHPTPRVAGAVATVLGLSRLALDLGDLPAAEKLAAQAGVTIDPTGQDAVDTLTTVQATALHLQREVH